MLAGRGLDSHAVRSTVTLTFHLPSHIVSTSFHSGLSLNLTYFDSTPCVLHTMPIHVIHIPD